MSAAAGLKPAPPPRRGRANIAGQAHQGVGLATGGAGRISPRVPRAGFVSPRLPAGLSKPPTAPHLSVTWGAVQEPSLPPLLVDNGNGHIQRRYFFTERAHETDRMPAQKHFDVIMGDTPPEQPADHLYCRYVDFLKEGNEPDAAKLGLLDEHQHANPEAIYEWIRNARPRTRLDAAPMFVLAKQLVSNLMDGDLAEAHKRRERVEKKLQAVEMKMEIQQRAHNQEEASLREAAKDRELQLTQEGTELRQQLAAANARMAELMQRRDEWVEASRRHDVEVATLTQEVARRDGVEQVLISEQKRLQDGE